MDIVDGGACLALKAEVGATFARILAYFREDGARSVGEIERAIHDRNAAALVRPAHMLKGEALQFGAVALGELAERIEMVARECVENQVMPTMLTDDVPALRPLFERTLAVLSHGAIAAPAGLERPVFGRKSGAAR